MNPQLSEDTNASHSQSPWKDFLIVTSQMVILVKVDLVVRVSFIYGISYKLQLPLYYSLYITFLLSHFYFVVIFC